MNGLRKEIIKTSQKRTEGKVRGQSANAENISDGAFLQDSLEKLLRRDQSAKVTPTFSKVGRPAKLRHYTTQPGPDALELLERLKLLKNDIMGLSDELTDYTNERLQLAVTRFFFEALIDERRAKKATPEPPFLEPLQEPSIGDNIAKIWQAKAQFDREVQAEADTNQKSPSSYFVPTSVSLGGFQP